LQNHQTIRNMIYRLLSLTILLFPFYQLLAQDTESTIIIDPNKMKIQSTYFGGGSAYIDPAQEEALKEFIFSVENINRYEVLINSFTDNIGSREYNQWLSQQRSAAVLEILGELELDIDLILKADFGEDDPVFNNNTREGKFKNRRVDVILRPITF